MAILAITLIYYVAIQIPILAIQDSKVRTTCVRYGFKSLTIRRYGPQYNNL